MSIYNENPIDIVVPWVNSEDDTWQKDFLYWSKKETGNTDRCRIRDLGQLKYFFRSIEQNCPWVRYVWLVVYGPTQIPAWLNKNHPKLKIIYHNEFIPKELLPTFNSFVIDMNLHRIEELSNNFIFCNDDMLFLSPLKETDFFKKDRPQFSFNYLKPGVWNNNRQSFDKTLKHTFNFIKEITGKNYTCPLLYHMPIPLSKTLYMFMWEKYKNKLMSSLNNSKFRKEKNYFNWLFFFLQQIYKLGDNNNFKRNFLQLNNNVTSKDISNILNSKGLGCINDGEQLSNKNEKMVKLLLINLLDKKFRKSKFEL